jgi:hypothetical protein
LTRLKIVEDFSCLVRPDNGKNDHRKKFKLHCGSHCWTQRQLLGVYMKTQKACLSIVLALGLTTAMVHGTEIFNFANIAGASIQFNGTASSFQFNASSGNEWAITTESAGSDAVGLVGTFGGGPWTYGAISGSLVQSATVNSTPATLAINDGAGHLATANISWVDVTTYGGTGYLNVNAVLNLSNLAYSGANPDLLSFFSAPTGDLTLSFQFNPAMSLTQLTAGSGPYLTSFSGSLTSVPEPGTMLLAGLGGGLLLLLRSRRQASRN